MAEAAVNQQVLPAPENRMMVARMNPIDVVAQSRTVHHIARLVGLAAAVAIGTVIAIWTSEPNFAPLYSNMSGQDTALVADVLSANDIEYRLDASSGSILVDQSRLGEARLKLASQGLPEGNPQGMEMLQDEQGLGTSQFIESARYNRALETELVRSIESIRNVATARVHLAIPEQSIFIRNRTKPSASVVIKLNPGRILNPGQVEAIAQMVASSIPLMESSQVTIVDQFGRLLSEDGDAGMALSTKQFDYSRTLENSYADRIINLLQPIVGDGKVNAQVTAQLDFSAVESTREAFDPERSVIRSEQISEEETSSFTQAVGIPGALSNQPPAAGTTGDELVVTETGAAETPSNQNRSSVRNYEVDRIISHTLSPTGVIQRLSVAVIIDDKSIVNDSGNTEKIPYTEEEMASFVTLVKETIGFDTSRGDSISVINTSFKERIVEEVEFIPWWQDLLNDVSILNLIKQVLGAIGLLIVYFVFGRPFLRSLKLGSSEGGNSKSAIGGVEGAPMPISQNYAQAPEYAGVPGIPNLADDPNNPAAIMRRKDATYGQKIDMARTLVMDDPARVANVMKQWAGQS